MSPKRRKLDDVGGVAEVASMDATTVAQSRAPVSVFDQSHAADSKFNSSWRRVMEEPAATWSTPLVAMLEAGLIRTEPRGVISR